MRRSDQKFEGTISVVVFSRWQNMGCCLSQNTASFVSCLRYIFLSKFDCQQGQAELEVQLDLFGSLVSIYYSCVGAKLGADLLF